ncbi:hypothetical protein CC78DRAFT_542599 [Lojkania enalia]|uniref:MARVEL domain-containing protein n=1 Tax=Lojkania enalia TaxID=147567 RepID=A0A9P4KD18_9PLEO|nr:hypothetical protein CC78DRAFT_542599 [Didymosphaeria enalia]
MYMSKGGAVPIPDWILIFRFFELIFALMTIALTAFSLSVNGGGPLQPPLIATIIIACFTVIPILILTTPLHLAQRKIYDARIALLLDGFAMLFWLGALAALASYQRIFRDYGKNNFFFYDKYTVCTRCRRAWRTGATAAWFSGVEFFLFLFTTLTFIYYFHCHLAGIPAPGVLYQGKGGEDPAGDTAGATTRTATPGAPVDQQQHELQPAQKKSTRSVTNPPYPTNGQPTSQPLQRNPPKQRKGGYDGYEAGSTEGYGVNTTEP